MPGSLQPVLPLPQDPSTQLVVLPTEPAAHPATHHLGEPHYFSLCVFLQSVFNVFIFNVFSQCLFSPLACHSTALLSYPITPLHPYPLNSTLTPYPYPSLTLTP